MPGETIQAKGERLAERVPPGGALKHFEAHGRQMFIGMIRQGLRPDLKLLDIGCGCLRGGYWMIHFLDPDCYHGIEPHAQMLEAGIDVLLDESTLELKRPKFDNNSDFNLEVFGEKFDFYTARSIWTHASKAMIQKMLDGFVATANPGAVFMTSFKAPRLFRPDYKGEAWVGVSHDSKQPGVVRHSLSWIRRQCAQRGLKVERVPQDDYGTQKWLRITHW